jgi:hypothetical protein
MTSDIVAHTAPEFFPGHQFFEAHGMELLGPPLIVE